MAFGNAVYYWSKSIRALRHEIRSVESLAIYSSAPPMVFHFSPQTVWYCCYANETLKPRLVIPLPVLGDHEIAAESIKALVLLSSNNLMIDRAVCSAARPHFGAATIEERCLGRTRHRWIPKGPRPHRRREGRPIHRSHQEVGTPIQTLHDGRGMFYRSCCPWLGSNWYQWCQSSLS